MRNEFWRGLGYGMLWGVLPLWIAAAVIPDAKTAWYVTLTYFAIIFTALGVLTRAAITKHRQQEETRR